MTDRVAHQPLSSGNTPSHLIAPVSPFQTGRDIKITDTDIILSIVVFVVGTLTTCTVVYFNEHLLPPLPGQVKHYFADWTLPTRYGAVGFYACTAVTTLYRFRFVKQSREQFYLIFGHLGICLTGLFTYFLGLKRNYAYVDSNGLALVPHLACMWCFTAPALSYLILVDRMSVGLSRSENYTVLGLFMCIAFGSLGIRTNYLPLCMCVSWVCLVWSLYRVRSLRITETPVDQSIKNFTKRANFVRYGYLMGLFGLFSLLVPAGVLDNDQLMVCFACLDAFTKGILTILNLDSQLVRLLALEGQLVAELQANTRRRDFMKYMFHEVRNPLNTIAMSLDYFCATDQTGWAKDFTFSTVFKSITELETTLDSFLLIQQMEEKTFALNYSSTRVASLLNEAVNSFKTRAGHACEIHLEFSQSILGSTRGPMYMIDIHNIQFVLTRMFVNADGLSPSSGDAMSVEVRSFNDPSFTVVDQKNGKKCIMVTVKSAAKPGIAELMSTFFNPYTALTTADFSEWGYNSMINFICRKIAERHGGRLTCELSENGYFLLQTVVFECDPMAAHGVKTVATNDLPHASLVAVDSPAEIVSTRSDASVSSSSPILHAFRHVVTNLKSHSPLVRVPAGRKSGSSGIASHAGTGALSGEWNCISMGEMQQLGTSSSVYRTKADLVLLCKHNSIRVMSNDAKTDIIDKLRSNEGGVVHVPQAIDNTMQATSPSPQQSSAKPSSCARPVSAAITATNSGHKINTTVPTSAIAQASSSSSSTKHLVPLVVNPEVDMKMRFKTLVALVVDDSAMNVKMLRRMLDLFDVRSDSAENGQIAVDAVKAKGANYYDIIFMDFTMPVMNGVEATGILRRMGCTRKIIAVTGNAMEADVKAFADVGADRVILKPIRQPVLQEELLAAADRANK